MSKTLREHLGLISPKIYNLVKEKAGVDPSLFYGVELEIEGLEADEDQRLKRIVAGMQYHKDGSLRNNGGEFVTLPMNFANLERVLTEFFRAYEYTEENYSERCSVHVHANCQDLSLSQIRLILCVYQVLEKILFQFIKADREDNIFCVPLGESNLGTRIMSSDDDLIQLANRKWRKYTALNLLPMYTQGTMEFRHMAGTNDQKFILQWCNIIGSMFKYARENKFEDVIKSIMTLNTSSAYATFMQGIFDGEIYDLLAVGPWREYLEEGVINMKCMLAPRPKEEKKNTFAYDYINPFQLGGGIAPVQPAEQIRDPVLGPAHWAFQSRAYQAEIDRVNRNHLEEEGGLLYPDINTQAAYLRDWLRVRGEEQAQELNLLAAARRQIRPDARPGRPIPNPPGIARPVDPEQF